MMGVEEEIWDHWGHRIGDGGNGNYHSDQGLYFLFTKDAIIILSWGMCRVGGNCMVHLCDYVDPLNLITKCLGGGWLVCTLLGLGSWFFAT